MLKKKMIKKKQPKKQTKTLILISELYKTCTSCQ